MAARRFTLLRHAQSTYNVQGILNGDPAVPVPLTDEGRRQAEAARRLLARASFDLAVHTRFPRTSETLLIVLGTQRPSVAVYPEFDDLDVGDFEGRPISVYREWRKVHDPDDDAPGGESRIDGLRRYAAGYQRLLDSGARRVVAVLHDIPIRFLVNAAHDTDPIAGPHQAVANAIPITYTEDDLRMGVARMNQRAEMRRAE